MMRADRAGPPSGPAPHRLEAALHATVLIPQQTDADYHEMEAVLLAFVDDVRCELTAAEPLPRLRQLVSAHVRWRLERPRIAQALDIVLGPRTRVNDLPEEHRRRVRAIKRVYMDELRCVLKAGAKAGTFDFPDLRVTTFAILSLCGSAHTWYDPDGDLTVDQVAEMYADFAAGMVRAPMRCVA